MALEFYPGEVAHLYSSEDGRPATFLIASSADVMAEEEDEVYKNLGIAERSTGSLPPSRTRRKQRHRSEDDMSPMRLSHVDLLRQPDSLPSYAMPHKITTSSTGDMGDRSPLRNGFVTLPKWSSPAVPSEVVCMPVKMTSKSKTCCEANCATDVARRTVKPASKTYVLAVACMCVMCIVCITTASQYLIVRRLAHDDCHIAAAASGKFVFSSCKFYRLLCYIGYYVISVIMLY